MWRIEVGFKPGVRDALGETLKRQIVEDLRLAVDRVETVAVYGIAMDLTSEQAESVARDLLADPVTQEYSINSPLKRDFGRAIEVGYKPGVTDNVGMTTVEGIRDLLGMEPGEKDKVHTSRLYLLSGDIPRPVAERICTGLLANPIVEEFSVWGPDGGGPPSPADREVATGEPRVAEIDLDVGDARLATISEQGVLSLSLEEMRAIRAYFKRPDVTKDRRRFGLGGRPTDVELEMLAQTWSEHCKHKVFNATIDYEEDGREERIESIFRTYIRGATEEIVKEKDWLVSVFTDNAGVISFDDDYNLVFKVETHNHPSALDPYGGAVTGIVGVNRDPMGTGLGANLIFNTDVFCFGPPDFPHEKLPPAVLHPKRIFRGVRKGVEDGGNKVGIPTVNGAILFDEPYTYNPLVYCGTGGIMPKRIAGRDSHVKRVDPGDLIVMVGGRIGKDGIHGATFSSTKLDEETSPTAVQIGAPIVQKKMQDALIEARDLGLYNAITDNGAGGLSSSVGEMSQFCGGCEVDLEKAPVKYAGLDPWELWVSESQERMTLAVPPANVDEFLEICRRRDVEATVIGTFVPSGKVHVRHAGRTVAHIDLDFLHEGLPGLRLSARWKPPSGPSPGVSPVASSADGLVKAGAGPLALESEIDPSDALKQILGSLNVCSKEWVIRQYDHEVQGASVVKPLVGVKDDGPSDAAVIRPVPGSSRGVVVSNGINPRYGAIDTEAMAESAVDEAVRNAVAVGADPDHIAILDNFCWGNPILSDRNPEGDFKLAQLVRAARGCYNAATGLGVPFISGKDSLHNEYQLADRTISIPPTLLISAMGVIEDCERAVTMDAKEPGDLIYLLGETAREMGGSHYLMLKGLTGETVPGLNAQRARSLYRALHRAIKEGVVSSCHDCSEGGIAVALAETAFAGGFGIAVDVAKIPAAAAGAPYADAELLFSESNSRFVVSVSPNDRERFEALMEDQRIGLVGEVSRDGRFRVYGVSGEEIMDTSNDELKEAWQAPLRW